MKRQGSSIIFINDNNEILLFLRDDKPSIPFPNMWDLPGGHVEENETPEQSIVREMKEELELDIKECELFSVNEFPDRICDIHYKSMKKVASGREYLLACELRFNGIQVHTGNSS